MFEFDPKHSEALARQTEDMLYTVRMTDAPVAKTAPVPANPIHPVFTLTSAHIIGTPTFFETLVTGDGEETGRFWTSDGKRIGWEGEAFQKLKAFATKLASTKPLKGFVSFEFIMTEMFDWLRGTLEKRYSEGFPERLKVRCEEEVQEREIWIPLHQTYAKNPFSIGPVAFETISKEMMDAWYTRRGEISDPASAAGVNRERSKWQATLAACTSVRAERNEQEVAKTLSLSLLI